jgi:hypothetical protein
LIEELVMFKTAGSSRIVAEIALDKTSVISSIPFRHLISNRTFEIEIRDLVSLASLLSPSYVLFLASAKFFEELLSPIGGGRSAARFVG